MYQGKADGTGHRRQAAAVIAELVGEQQAGGAAGGAGVRRRRGGGPADLAGDLEVAAVGGDGLAREGDMQRLSGGGGEIPQRGAFGGERRGHEIALAWRGGLQVA